VIEIGSLKRAEIAFATIYVRALFGPTLIYQPFFSGMETGHHLF
jgi:hypothetical protein